MGHQEMIRSRQKISVGKGNRRCIMSSNRKGIIRKYGLNICRQSFRENAENLGFEKLR